MKKINDAYKSRARRFLSGVRRKTKRSYGYIFCLMCNKKFVRNTSTQIYCGSWYAKQGCSYKNSLRIRERTAYMKKYRESHSEYFKKKINEWAIKNPEKIQKYRLAFKQRNPDYWKTPAH